MNIDIEQEIGSERKLIAYEVLLPDTTKFVNYMVVYLLTNTRHVLNILAYIRKVQYNYRKKSKNWDTINYYRDCPTNVIVGFYSTILRSKDADRITNRVDTDQTAP